MTAPWLDDGDVQLYHGDAASVLRSLPAGSVQTCITSPPYWGLRDYGADDQLGLEATPDAYVERLVAVFREVWRVLRDDGTLWLNLGDSYFGGGQDGGQFGSQKTKVKWAGKGNREVVKRGEPHPDHGLKFKDLCGIPWRVAFALQQPWYAGTIRNEFDRVWLAAMIDAEGCMFIHKRKIGQSNGQGYERKSDSYGAGLEVSSTDRVIVERCMEIAGIGSICEQSPEQNGRRKQTLYRWNARSNACRDVIRELYPYLVAKQHEARLLLGCPPSGPDAERAHESLKAIHQGGVPTIDFAAPESLFSPGWYLRSDIIWAKKNCMPESVTDRPTKAHEYVFLLSKRPRYFYDADAVREPHARLWDPATNGGSMATTRHHEAHIGGSNRHERAYPAPDPAGRNLRSVWQIATQPTPEAHFATYPEALVERCIKAGTSEAGGCAMCGAPWQRQTERERIVKVPDTPHPSAIASSELHGCRDANFSASGGGHMLVETTGWRQPCACDTLVTQPQVVLDPFVGSGTTALVARKHGRRCIGIDLSSEYLAIAAKRTQQLSLLGEGAA